MGLATLRLLAAAVASGDESTRRLLGLRLGAVPGTPQLINDDEGLMGWRSLGCRHQALGPGWKGQGQQGINSTETSWLDVASCHFLRQQDGGPRAQS